jgi:hypothetical protein
MADEYPIRGRLADEGGAFGPFSGRFRLKWSDFSIQCDQFPARHPQIGQRGRGLEVRCALHKPTVTHLDVPELPFDHVERVIGPQPEGSA